MPTRTAALLAVLMTGLAGCAPTSGVIIEASKPTVGSMAPDIEYVSADGRQASFNRVRLPVTIVAFTSPAGSNCSWLDPRVVNLADHFWDLPVTVAQFSLPEGKCPHGPACMEVSNLHKGGLMSLCDGARIAWRAYGQPAPGSLILIDRNGKIQMTESLDAPKQIVDAAQRLGNAEAQRREAANQE